VHDARARSARAPLLYLLRTLTEKAAGVSLFPFAKADKIHYI
jgi:hypothetical protein